MMGEDWLAEVRHDHIVSEIGLTLHIGHVQKCVNRFLTFTHFSHILTLQTSVNLDIMNSLIRFTAFKKASNYKENSVFTYIFRSRIFDYS